MIRYNNMTLKREGYVPGLIDDELKRYLSIFDAVNNDISSMVLDSDPSFQHPTGLKARRQDPKTAKMKRAILVIYTKF